MKNLQWNQQPTHTWNNSQPSSWQSHQWRSNETQLWAVRHWQKRRYGHQTLQRRLWHRGTCWWFMLHWWNLPRFFEGTLFLVGNDEMMRWRTNVFSFFFPVLFRARSSVHRSTPCDPHPSPAVSVFVCVVHVSVLFIDLFFYVRWDWDPFFSISFGYFFSSSLLFCFYYFSSSSSFLLFFFSSLLLRFKRCTHADQRHHWHGNVQDWSMARTEPGRARHCQNRPIHVCQLRRVLHVSVHSVLFFFSGLTNTTFVLF